MDDPRIQPFLTMLHAGSGYLYQVAVLLAGDPDEGEKMLTEALWAAYTRDGTPKSKASFRRAVLAGMDLMPVSVPSPLPAVRGSEAAEAFSALNTPLQRAVAVCMELGYAPKDAASRAGVPVKTLNAALSDLSKREGGDKLPHLLHTALVASPGPDMEKLRRTLESRAAEWKRPSQWGRKTVKALLYTLLGIFICGLCWLVAALLG